MTESIVSAFVEAYEPYVRRRLAELGLDPTGLEEAVATGSEWLRTALEELLAEPFASQPRGPLEVFQESMRFPTESLGATGAEPLQRDPVVANALPGDLYGLAPAASHELGEKAWQAHLAWGAAKAAALRAVGAVAVLSRNLLDRSKLEAALDGGGHEVMVIKGGELPDGVSTVVADLEHPEAMAVLEAAARAGVRAIAYGPHVAEDAMEDARSAGAEAIPRSKVLRDPAAFVARL